MTHTSQLLVISLVAVLGAAVFLTSGSSGGSNGILAGATEAHAASASSITPADRAAYAGDKDWEVIGGPVKIGSVKAAPEASSATATAAAPRARLPW